MSTNLRSSKEANLWMCWVPSKSRRECVIGFTTLTNSCSSLELKWAGFFQNTAEESRGQQQEAITITGTTYSRSDTIP